MRRNPYSFIIGLQVCSLAVMVGTLSAEPREHAREKIHKLEILSKMHTMEEFIPSMKGPTDTQFFELEQDGKPGLLWLKSARVDVIDDDAETISAEHLCHSNLFFKDFGEHQEMFLGKVTSNQKFIDINQGQLEVRMPDGFGIPMMSTEQLRFHSMIINPTAQSEPFQARVRTTFEYLRDDELTGPIKALSQRAIRLRIPVALAEGHEHHALSSEIDNSGHDESEGLQCDPEQETYQGQALTETATKNIFKTDPDGPIWSVHWFVPPGRHEYRYKIDNGLRMPFKETIVHMITTHVHPYAESVELYDLTDGKRVFRTEIETFDGSSGIANIPHYSSTEGLSVHKDHLYEIVVVYNNTTAEDVDAMALLYLYYWDRDFARPTAHASR